MAAEGAAARAAGLDKAAAGDVSVPTTWQGGTWARVGGEVAERLKAAVC